MNAAGVGAGDGLISARRKVNSGARRQASAIADQIYSAMQGVLAQLDAQLAALNAMKVVVSVRWDRSGRDHKEALENYRPEAGSGSASIRTCTVRRTRSSRRLSGSSSSRPTTQRRLRRARPVRSRAPPRSRLGCGGESEAAQQRERPDHADPTSTTREVGQEFFLSSQALNTQAAPGPDVAVAPKGASGAGGERRPGTAVVESDGEPIWLRRRADGSYARLRLGTSLMPALTKAFAQDRCRGAPQLRLATRPDRGGLAHRRRRRPGQGRGLQPVLEEQCLPPVLRRDVLPDSVS